MHARSLFGLKNDEWKFQRSEIAGAFSSSRLKVFHEKSQKILKQFESFIREENCFEATKLSSKFFAAMFEKSLLSTEPTISSEKSELQKMSENLSLKSSFTTFIKTMLIAAFPFTKEKVKIQYSDAEDQQKFVEKIQKAVKDHQKDESFLDYLVQIKNSKKDISDVDLASHSAPFLSHGLEVSAIALSHALYEVEKLIKKLFVKAQ